MSKLLAIRGFLAGKGAISLGIFILIVQLFLFIRAESIFGSDAQKIQKEMTVYFILNLSVLAFLGIKSPDVNLNLVYLGLFGLWFILTSLVLLLLVPVKIPASTLASVSVSGLGYSLFYSFSKAYPEEIVFRQILPINAKFGSLLSNFLFAIFHGVLGVNIISVALLFTLGMFWSFIVKIYPKGGYVASTGSHTAWNTHGFGKLAEILGISIIRGVGG